MAQAVFDDHPIEQYLRESGEIPELMPGGTVEFSREPSYDPYHIPIFRQYLQHLVHPLLNARFHILESTGLRSHSAASEFAERFKYIVISSSMLSSSLASSPPNRAPTPTTPGHYERSTPSCQSTTTMTTLTRASPSTSLLALSLACLIPAALVQGYYISCVLIFAAVKICSDCVLSLPASFTSSRGEESWPMTLESLEALVSANNAWDNVVSDALRVLEEEERNSLHPVSPSSQSPSLRIALSSSLHTTQTQCDNVRQLLSALTSPALLSQFSEMYAPPSPPPVHKTLSPRTRPSSLVHPALHPSNSYAHANAVDDADMRTRIRTSSAPFAFPANKRSTWNGSYMSLAGAAPRRQKRRSNLSTIVRMEDFKTSTTPNMKGSASAPSTPSQPLNNSSPAVVDAGVDADVEEEPFGVMALDLHRKRHSARTSLFEGPFRPESLSIASSAHGSPLSTSSGSRFTTFSAAASRHSPLSLFNLHLAVRSALAAKRFACAHLLALRFHDAQRPNSSDDADGEDESYWEDVRSVVALLTSTLEDASARLGEALADVVRATATDDEASSVPPSPEHHPLDSLLLAPQSFAPVPSHLSRFAAHVDAISTALDDARGHLQASVASLHDAAAPAALEPYERLRRELGVALRECERGRSTLLELAHRTAAHGGAAEAGAEDDDDLPAARRDEHFSSGASDKTLFNVDEQPEAAKGALLLESAAAADERDDDASAHLIMAASAQHLPAPGAEQVFESLSAAPPPFARERSKLTREERIRLAKARRESGAAYALGVAEEGAPPPPPPREGWGPGGEVVQELKDVIWKVGEQRRKRTERPSSPGRAPPPPPP